MVIFIAKVELKYWIDLVFLDYSVEAVLLIAHLFLLFAPTAAASLISSQMTVKQIIQPMMFLPFVYFTRACLIN